MTLNYARGDSMGIHWIAAQCRGQSLHQLAVQHPENAETTTYTPDLSLAAISTYAHRFQRSHPAKLSSTFYSLQDAAKQNHADRKALVRLPLREGEQFVSGEEHERGIGHLLHLWRRCFT